VVGRVWREVSQTTELSVLSVKSTAWKQPVEYDLTHKHQHVFKALSVEHQTVVHSCFY
jgi:hypothetical protein